MDFSTISGIPTHPLFVHLPVIGIPITALALLAYVLLPAKRPTLIWFVGGLTIFITGATLIAAQSGESLQEKLAPEDRNSALVHQHAELGDQTKAIMLIFAAATLAYLALDWYRRRQQAEPGDTKSTSRRSLLSNGIIAFTVLSLTLGGLATVWDVRTGHAGAKAAWHDALPADSGPDSASTGP